jgi:hypothetical protein
MDDDLNNGFVSVFDPIGNEKELITVPYKIKTANFDMARFSIGTD